MGAKEQFARTAEKLWINIRELLSTTSARKISLKESFLNEETWKVNSKKRNRKFHNTSTNDIYIRVIKVLSQQQTNAFFTIQSSSEGSNSWKFH